MNCKFETPYTSDGYTTPPETNRTAVWVALGGLAIVGLLLWRNR